MSNTKEKKMEKPLSIKLTQSVKEALDKKCQQDERSFSYVIEKALRKDLGIDK